MKPYSKKRYHGWSHYGRKAIRWMTRRGEWDDLGPAGLNKSAARREAKEEIEKELAFCTNCNDESIIAYYRDDGLCLPCSEDR
jgi:hypothetical protein